MMLDLLVEVTG